MSNLLERVTCHLRARRHALFGTDGTGDAGDTVIARTEAGRMAAHWKTGLGRHRALRGHDLRYGRVAPSRLVRRFERILLL